ncbi:MAG: Cys-Gln thioester bond-forming surface protein [Oscillospiraceae bacterium]|nr:Cys-Gln thioester bond-forming surface protein [Oscillospiraceae bacterium]
MAKKMKKMLAMFMVLCMMVSMFTLTALAVDDSQASESTTVSTESNTVDGLTETTTTTTTSTTNENGDNTITVTVEKVTNGTTAEGVTVDRSETFTETSVIDAAGTETGSSWVEEGSETTVETVPSNDKISVDVIVDGEIQKDASGGSETADTTVTGDVKTGKDDAEYDQTTVTITDRTAEVTVGEITTSTGDVIYVDEDGNIVGRTDDGFNYYWSDIYTVDGKSIIDGEASGSQWKTGTAYWYIEEADGTLTSIGHEGVCQRVVACDNGTPDDYSDDYEVGGLYCVDMSTGIKESFKYRMANLEDADYYTEEEAAHLRAIMTYGYTWNDDDDNGHTNLESIKAMLKDAQENGDEATKELLKDLDFSSLSREQAATATGMAVWTFGNRVELEEGQRVVVKNGANGNDGNALIEGLYRYLVTLTKEADEDETQIINEEKFIENLEFIVGGMAEGNESNADADEANDVYNVDLKFSLVVEPSKTNDDLIVKVVDSEGNIVKTARIAGEQQEGETFGYAKTEIDENGKTYYVLEGLQLAENSNSTFNLKLEGTQLLKEGVYVFESQHLSLEETVASYIQYFTDMGVLEDMIEKYGTLEGLENKIRNDFAGKSIVDSQNFIGKWQGTAEVDANLQFNLTFNVEESIVTTERIWREEGDPTAEPVPVGNGGGFGVFRLGARGTALETIEEEEVPLADAPQTGDEVMIFAVLTVLAGISLMALHVSEKKRKEEV